MHNDRSTETMNMFGGGFLVVTFLHLKFANLLMITAFHALSTWKKKDYSVVEIYRYADFIATCMLAYSVVDPYQWAHWLFSLTSVVLPRTRQVYTIYTLLV